MQYTIPEHGAKEEVKSLYSYSTMFLQVIMPSGESA
jgi:hypothetical protein